VFTGGYQVKLITFTARMTAFNRTFPHAPYHFDSRG